MKKWLGVPQIERYEAYVKDWHYFLKDVQAVIRETESDEMIKSINLFLLNGFFVKLYESLSAQAKEAEFYGQFYERLKEAREGMDFYR